VPGGPGKNGLSASHTIGTLLVAILIDGLPSACLLHERAKQRLDGPLDALGIQQGSWQLFAPSVDKVNTRVSARIRFADGAEALWQQPDWTAMSSWQRLRTFRQAEYYDNIRFDQNRAAWAALTRYLARTVPHPRGGGAPPVQVVLTRHWAEIPAPGRVRLPAGPYLRFTGKFDFFTWNRAP
jgi:hypothetical protein